MKNLFVKIASCIRCCSFLLLVIFVFSCSKDEGPFIIADDNSNVNLKKKVMVNEPVCLEGTSNFYVYAPKMDKVVMDGALPSKATLTVDGENLIFAVKEYFGPPMPENLYREVTFSGKITSSGVVMFSWPETWKEFGQDRYDVLGQFLDHTGCIAHGPGINKGTVIYKGYFDGTTFYAKTHFIGKQINPEPTMDEYWNIDGPAKIEFSMNLTIVE